MYESYELAEPFLETPLDPLSMTGSDIYKMMLSASLGGKSLIGAASSGSGEVLNKVSYDFAETHITGYVQFKDTSMAMDPLDTDGKIVAKGGKKFYGITKANAFMVVRESTVWASSAINRVKSAAVLAASLAGSGVEAEVAVAVGGDALGEPLGVDMLANVVTPLSLAKRDVATTAKRRHALYLADHYVQDLTWNDTQLNSGVFDESDAIDWARITTIAKYLGACNAAVDSRFRDLATAYPIPFALVDRHWTKVTMKPYLDVSDHFKNLPRLTLPSGCTIRAAEKVRDLKQIVRADLLSLKANGMMFGDILRAMDAVKVARPKMKSILPTDVLAGYVTHTVKEDEVHLLVGNTESSYNALVSAIVARAKEDSDVYKLLMELESTDWSGLDGEGLHRAALKRAIEGAIGSDTFVSAAASLGVVLGDPNLALTRMAKLKRSLTSTSSAFSDRLVVTDRTIEGLGRAVAKSAKVLRTGNTKFLAPPPLLANPSAAIKAGQKMQMLKAAKEYLSDAKSFWSERYEMKAKYIKETGGPKELMVYYSIASCAFTTLEVTQLIEWENGYVSDMNKSYLARAAKNYCRKRTIKLPESTPTETVWEYAQRLDKALNPEVSFYKATIFVSEKLSMLAGDFAAESVFSGASALAALGDLEAVEAELIAEKALEAKVAEEDVREGFLDTTEKAKELLASVPKVAPPPPPAKVDKFASLFGDDDDDIIFKDPTKYRATWDGVMDPDAAARANGYSDYSAAISEIDDRCIYDTENRFTQVALSSLAEEELALSNDGELNVI